MRRLIVIFHIIALGILGLTPSLVSSAELDPCAVVEQVASRPTVGIATQLWRNLAAFLYGPGPSASIAAAGSDTKPLYFTKAADYALVPYCTIEGAQLGQSLPFPLGLTVQKLGERTWKYQGSQKNYFYVLTEYGLKFYIPPEELAPLESGKTYLFSDAPEPVAYCLGRPSCRSKTRDNHVLQSNLRYATTAASLDNLRSCGPVKIEPFNVGGIPTNEKNAFIQPCVIDPETQKPAELGSLRHVTEKEARQRFSVPVAGAFQGSAVGFVNKLASGKVLDRKECNDTIDYSKTLTTAAGVELSLYTAHAGFDAEYVRKLVSELDKDHFYLFTTYSHWQLTPSDDIKAEEFRDLTFDARCENSQPVEGLDITLYDPHFRGGSLIITAKELRDIYIESFGLKGYSNIAVKDADQLGIKDSNDIKDGKFWRIRGVPQYLRWRTLLRHYVQNTDPMKDILNTWPIDQQKWVADFFAHVILVSSFDFPSTHDGEVMP